MDRCGDVDTVALARAPVSQPIATEHDVLQRNAQSADDLTLFAEARAHVRNARAPNTRRAYRAAWDAWCAWCVVRGVPATPADPGELILHLTQLSRRCAPNTVRLALSAIVVVDRRARATAALPRPVSLRDHPLVSDWYDGWSRTHPRAPKRKAPYVTPAQIELMIQQAQERPANTSAQAHIVQYARDRALLLLGVCAALRVSELVALDVGDVTQHPRGLAVTVRSSKTDKEGESHVRGVVQQARQLRCPIDAWLTWLKIRGDWAGPAFVPITRRGTLEQTRLSDAAMRRLVVKRGKACGIDLSSHSMRASFATRATELRKPLVKIAEQGDWSRLDTLRGYVRQGELFDDSPTAGLLDD